MSKASLGFLPPTLVLKHNSECSGTVAKKWALAQRPDRRVLRNEAKGWATALADRGSSLSAGPRPWAPSWYPFSRSQRQRVCPVSHSSANDRSWGSAVTKSTESFFLVAIWTCTQPGYAELIHYTEWGEGSSKLNLSCLYMSGLLEQHVSLRLKWHQSTGYC